MPASTSAQLRDGAASIAYRSFQLAGVATLYVVRSRQQVRTIEPPDLVLTELRRAVRPGMAPDMPLFEGARGGTLRRDDFYERAWRPALVAAGLAPDRYKFHSARHFAVSSMLGRSV